MPDLIQLDGVTVRFGSLLALDNVNLSVRAGEIVALVGPNGAGKSTALRVACGQIWPTAGRATIDGRDPAEAKAIFGVVPDKDNHFEEFTARRNLAFFAGLYEVPTSRIDESLRLAELESAAERKVREFSLGMRRRLLLARAILHKPKTLLLDEPLANLDEPGVTVANGIIQKVRNDGGCVLFTAHRIDQTKHCDRLFMIERGRLMWSGNPSEILK